MNNAILAAVCVTAIYCLLVLLIYLFQRKLIYFPFTLDAPASPQEEMEVVALCTADGLQLKAWYKQPVTPDAPTLVYFHGNAGHIGHRAFLVLPYLKAGFGVLLVTYRGYSGNPGKPSEEGLYSDARAALEFLGNRGVPGSKLVLYGESIGCAVACQMATEYAVRAIILQAPFTTLEDVGSYHYPILPVRYLLKDKFNSLQKAPKVHVPVLILHGESDAIIPPSCSHTLYNAFSGPKERVVIPHTGHNDLFEPQLVIDFIRWPQQHE